MARFKKGDKKPANSGRKKGQPNTLTKTVREVVLATFNNLQQDPKANLQAWAKENPKEFYIIASKLIPTEIATTGQAIVINVNTPD